MEDGAYCPGALESVLDFGKGEANHLAASYPGFGASVKLTSF